MSIFTAPNRANQQPLIALRLTDSNRPSPAAPSRAAPLLASLLICLCLLTLTVPFSQPWQGPISTPPASLPAAAWAGPSVNPRTPVPDVR